MELVITRTQTTPVIEEFMKSMTELNLIHYASEASKEMEFENDEEFYEAVKRAMTICSSAGIPLEGNFKLIFKCSSKNISYDWKLSLLACQLVCINDKTSNSNVAYKQIRLLRASL
jgi:hypothetical protein